MTTLKKSSDYRIVRFDEDPTKVYEQIYLVYYDDYNNPVIRDKDPAIIEGLFINGKSELRFNLKQIQKAVERPVLFNKDLTIKK